MFAYGEKHPFIFEIMLTIVSFALVILLTIAASVFGLSSDLTTSIARIAVGLLLMLVYRRAFKGEKPKNNLLIALPALLFAGWNLYYNLSSGNAFGDLECFITAFITALAPAIFEEVIYRGIFIYNMDKSDFNGFGCVFFSALFFALIHFTNLAGNDLVSVALQVVYAFAVGLVLAMIYVRNRRILQIIFLHFLIDFTNRIYVGKISTSTRLQIIIFVGLLIAEAAYAIVLSFMNKNKE